MVRVSAAFRHPLFLASLLVLLINDHLLKGAGILPGAITGKLSDFAGMVVAPFVLAWVLRAKDRRALIAAHVAIGIGFAAIKLSPAFAHVVELAMSFVSWRIWSDPTDLVALPMLAIGYLAIVRTLEHGRQSSWRTAIECLALVVSALACVATSQTCDEDDTCGTWVPSMLPTGMTQLVNDAGYEQTVLVRPLRPSVAISCRAITEPLKWVSPRAFAAPQRWLLAPGTSVPLPTSSCSIYWIEVDDASVLVALNSSAATVQTSHTLGTIARVSASGLQLVDNEALLVPFYPDAFPTADVCEGEDHAPLQWTGEFDERPIEVRSVRAVPGDCVTIDYVPLDPDARPSEDEAGDDVVPRDDEPTREAFVCGVTPDDLMLPIGEPIMVESFAFDRTVLGFQWEGGSVRLHRQQWDGNDLPNGLEASVASCVRFDECSGSAAPVTLAVTAPWTTSRTPDEAFRPEDGMEHVVRVVRGAQWGLLDQRCADEATYGLTEPSTFDWIERWGPATATRREWQPTRNVIDLFRAREPYAEER